MSAPQRLLLVFLPVLALVATMSGSVLAQPADARIASTCIAVAQNLPGAAYVNFTPGPSLSARLAAAADAAVKITYAGHATFAIESPDGVRIATDFSGAYGADFAPRIVTMNKAHRTHYTDNPPPEIEHILRGWNPDGGPARHRLKVDDVVIRNVPTDIRDWSGNLERDGNSIFIFETAGLCIGHLGHLHTRLSDKQYGEIGRLDVLMVPIDGGLTQSVETMSEVARRLSSSIILPMHRHTTPIADFTAQMGDQLAVEFRPERSVSVSLNSLPKRPTIVVLDGV